MAEEEKKNKEQCLGQQVEKCDDPTFRWEEFPLEVYEVLVKYLDGLSLMNLCLTSTCISESTLEPFCSDSYQKREDHWRNFCSKNLEPSLVCKIFSSYVDADALNNETKEIPQEERSNRKLCLVSWEDVFKAYLFFSNTLVYGKAVNQRLFTLENKLKAELMCAKDTFVPLNKYTVNPQYAFMIRSGAGNIILNVMTPSPREDSDSSRINMVVTEVSGNGRNVEYKHVSSICSKAEDLFELKIVYFPRMRNLNGSRFFHVDRIVLSICKDCVSIAPLLGGITRKMAWRAMEEPQTPQRNGGKLLTAQSCPVFEVRENLVVVWPLPTALTFLLMVVAREQDGYELSVLYRLQFDGMEAVWNQIVNSPLHYLAIVDEYDGCAMMNEQARNMVMGGSGYSYRSTMEPKNYGLTLVSYKYETISLRPTMTVDNVFDTTVERWKPENHCRNATMCDDAMRDPTCSAKGFGLFVFCSNTAIAASWDSMLWTFGKLTFPKLHTGQTCAQNLVTHVQVINYNNGLLLVVNEDIILAEIDYKSSAELGPHVEVKPLRLFQTKLASLYKEITHIELSFDEGQPFFLIVAKRKPRMQKAKRVRDEFSLAMLRIDFEC